MAVSLSILSTSPGRAPPDGVESRAAGSPDPLPTIAARGGNCLDRIPRRRPDNAGVVGARVFKHLISIDIPRRLEAVAPQPLTRVLLALALLAGVATGRPVLDAVVPGVSPYVLLGLAVLVAAMTGGWIAGALVMGLGAGFVLFTIPGPTPPRYVSPVLFALSASAVIAMAEALRSAARRIVAGQAALDDREAWLEMAAVSAGLGVWEWRRSTGELFLSAKAREIFGFPAAGPVTTQMVAAILNRGDIVRTLEHARRALDPVPDDDRTFDYRIVTVAGRHRRIALNARAVFATVKGVRRATRYIGTLRDVTARRAVQAERSLSATRLRLAVEAGRLAVWHSDVAKGVVHGPEFNTILGYPPDKLLTAEDVRGRYLPGELRRLRDITNAAYARGERHVEVEARFRRLDGQVRWLLMRGELTLNAEGEPRAGVGVAMDITDRKAAEEHMTLLAHEVDHRANNLLAIVQSLVRMSKAPTPDALQKVLIGRITALARAHNLLSVARWKSASLRRLVEEELLAFSLADAERTGSGRVSILGQDIALSPSAAEAVAMVLHELATNASKYGALSAPAGQVTVSWTREDTGALTIRWTETGGPPVTTPTRQGLGAVLLARALAGGLRGETSMDWRPEGLSCELRLPGAALVDAEGG